LHRLSSSFVLGYHGCSKVVGEKLLAGEQFKPSDNDYDWLGPGIYFWENNPARAIAWARLRMKNSAEAFAVGTVIELGYCLDLTTQSASEALTRSFDQMAAAHKKVGLDLPSNSPDPDKLRRNLDCAVIRTLHQTLEDERATPVDTVKGVFVEGEPLFPGSAIRALTHCQIAVRNPSCIKGVFRIPGA
jgi:hypothetical protein